MLKKSKFYFSLMLTALFSVSLLFSTNVKACDEAPQTFLSLYMNSDLIVLAKYDTNGKSVKSNEDEYGYTVDTPRNLLIKQVYKGLQNIKNVSFLYADYVSKEKSDVPAEDDHGGDHYFDLSKTKLGGEYLFFMSKDKETGKYYVTDYVSGVKETNNLAFYEQNINELKQIVAAKTTKYELLTEWIVKSIENKESREDGVADLSESFSGLPYQAADPKFSGKGPFVTVEGYGIYTVGVAKHLTQSQKDRVSKVLYSTIQEAWSAQTPQYVYGGIPTILSGIDKSRAILYAFDTLQKVEKSDSERRVVIMGFLNDALGDETYSTIYYDILDIEYKIEEAQKDNSQQSEKTIKDLNAAKEVKIVELEKRFKFMQNRKFTAVAVKTS